MRGKQMDLCYYTYFQRNIAPNMLNMQSILHVKHILINCDRFRQIFPKYYQTSYLKDHFKNTRPEENLSFLKAFSSSQSNQI